MSRTHQSVRNRSTIPQRNAVHVDAPSQQIVPHGRRIHPAEYAVMQSEEVRVTRDPLPMFLQAVRTFCALVRSLPSVQQKAVRLLTETQRVASNAGLDRTPASLNVIHGQLSPAVEELLNAFHACGERQRTEQRIEMVLLIQRIHHSLSL